MLPRWILGWCSIETNTKLEVACVLGPSIHPQLCPHPHLRLIKQVLFSESTSSPNTVEAPLSVVYHHMSLFLEMEKGDLELDEKRFSIVDIRRGYACRSGRAATTCQCVLVGFTVVDEQGIRDLERQGLPGPTFKRTASGFMLRPVLFLAF